MMRHYQWIENVISHKTNPPSSILIGLSRICLMVAGFAVFSGCQTLAGPQDFGDSPVMADYLEEPENPVVQVSGEETLGEKSKKNAKAVMNFVTGREQENPTRARGYYKEGDALFRKASSLPRDQARKVFAEAAKSFERAAEAAPKTALEQDSLYMQAESLFFADRLVEASDVYEKLQKDFPRNRHVDQVAARLFSISRYWVNVAKANDGSWWRALNLTDPKRPRMDVDGHAVRLLDQIRYDDPTGRLADDATMAAAAEYIRQNKFEEADEFLTDLRETFSDSEHLFLAHLLGIRCKLEVYAGPTYSGLVLEEADTLVRQTRQRFPDKMADPKYGEMVARAAAEIAYHRSERLAFRADYREKRKEYGAARIYYNELLKEHNDTPQAKTARQRLAKIEKLPAVPKQQLAWLTTIFPDSKASKPLQMTTPSGQQTEPPKTMLR
jgi:outer membrane protein assembly factor BamD (BamD/ComL family)